MAGQFQHNAAPHHHSNHAGHSVDTGDAVMARWLQSAGLQHLAAPLAAAALDHRLLPSLLVQDYSKCGVQSLEDKQKLFRLIKTISSGDFPPEPSTPPSYTRSVVMDGFLSPELRGDVAAGILDLHSIDDTELFSEASIPEPFQSPPSFVPVIEKGFEHESEAYAAARKYQQIRTRGHTDASPLRSASTEKERTGKENGVARIKVVVRKRPINKKEIARKEEDIIKIEGYKSSLIVHEPKLKVDLTAYVEKHEFVFDAVLDEDVTNDEVYRVTVEPIVPSIFQRTKATCFAYGQTGSGKTYTMQPLPLKASEDILDLMRRPSYRSEGFQLWLSFFEIYGGKLYDLLNERRKLCMREDGRQQVCIVGLKEYRVSDVQIVRDYIEKGNSTRSTGSTGANEESSRSHAILQLAIKKPQEGGDGRGLRIAGKLSFIDLAGSERGADTTDNDRQTRMEGAEINKSLLALKECIRALDNDQGHIPFRGSKLTEVLRDSFMGDSRTVMISCVSPNTGSCEHTLNTLRYADRVKGLSRNNNSKRDPSVPVANQRELNTSPPLMRPPVPPTPEVFRENRPVENGRRNGEQVVWQRQNSDRDLYRERDMYREREVSRERDLYREPDLHRERDLPRDHDLHPMASIDYGFPGRDDVRGSSISFDKERAYYRENYDHADSHVLSATGYHLDSQDQSKPYAPVSSRQRLAKDDKPQRPVNALPVKEDIPRIDRTSVIYRRSNRKDEFVPNAGQYRQKEVDVETDYPESGHDGHINAILEEEEEVIGAHRKEVEDTMEIVREEMRLLAEVDQPGSQIDRYVAQLNHVLSRKQAGIVNLQARLAKFQRHLKEQEILGRTVGLR